MWLVITPVVSDSGLHSGDLYDGDCTLRRGRINRVSLVVRYKSPIVLEDVQLSFQFQPHFLRVPPSPLDSSFPNFTFITVQSIPSCNSRLDHGPWRKQTYCVVPRSSQIDCQYRPPNAGTGRRTHKGGHKRHYKSRYECSECRCRSSTTGSALTGRPRRCSTCCGVEICAGPIRSNLRSGRKRGNKNDRGLTLYSWDRSGAPRERCCDLRY